MSSSSGHLGYATLAAGVEHRHELEVKRSRFIAVLRRIDDEAAARILVSSLRKEFHDARHHCSAFVLGADRAVQRSNDDGEPSGTAGAPMLEALLRNEPVDGMGVSHLCAVVVRYFGGVLLGTGGLLRAYSEVVTSALLTAPLLERRRMLNATVAVAHEDAGRLEHALRAAGHVMTEPGYGARLTELGLVLPDEDSADAVAALIAAITSGRATLEIRGSVWTELPLRAASSETSLTDPRRA